MTDVICATQMPLIGLAFVNFSDAIKLIEANENSHYVCSEVSLTYDNAHISYGLSLPYMWISPEVVFKLFVYVSCGNKKKIMCMAFFLNNI